MSSEKVESGFKLELGDIIQIIAPTNEGLDDQTFLITYIDDIHISIINTTTFQLQQLNVDEHDYITDESIRKIVLLSRSDVPGYARQNGLIPRTWVEIHFGGEFPGIVTGEISNLEEDQIEITTYPELDVIYIDFEYKGLPQHLPIDKILIREKPKSLGKYDSLADLRELMEEGEVDENDGAELAEASIEFVSTGESIIKIPEKAKANDNIREVLQSVYLDANDIFGEDLEEVVQMVEIPEAEKRYGIETQVNDLMDELLSTIPNYKRNKQVLDNIHHLIERFRELRARFSKIDETGNVVGAKFVGPLHKPLVATLMKLQTNLKWIVPVVSLKKTVISKNSSLEDVVVKSEGGDLLECADAMNRYYKSGGSDFEQSLKQFHQANLPFYPPDADSHHLFYEKDVETNIEAVVSNLEEFYSTVSHAGELVRSKYVIQRYNLGLSTVDSKSMKSGKRINILNELTPDDKMTLTSLIMMPESVMRFSKVDLPSTDILTKTTLSHNWLHKTRIFNKKRAISSYIVDNLEKELDYETLLDVDETLEIKGKKYKPDDPELLKMFAHLPYPEATIRDQIEEQKLARGLETTGRQLKFMSDLQEFTLSDDINDADRYQQFLNVIVPKTRLLIKLVQKYNKDKLSAVDVVKSLEPFAIYPEDITYKQYMEIRYFIKERIKAHRIALTTRGQEFSVIRNANYRVKEGKPNPVLRILSEKKELLDMFAESYSIGLELGTSPSELLLKINDTDNSALFLNLISFMLLSLITPKKLLDNSAPEIDDMSEAEKVKAQDCAKRFLAKRYRSISDLQRDNNVPGIIYDDEFDDTPYTIIKKYKDEQKKMLPPLFSEFLTESLIQKHDCPPVLAPDLAATLILGKKRVKDGEYAIVEIRPQLPEGADADKLSARERADVENESNIRMKIQYYRRLKDNWIRDEDVDEESFIDTNTLFCNLSRECVKNARLSTCESVGNAEDRLKRAGNVRILKEFEKRFTLTVAELEKELSDSINDGSRLIKRVGQLRELRAHRANNLAYEIGKYANKDDVVESPYAKLRDMILGQDDFVKKQFDICRLVETYCREPMVAELKEDEHWLYCKATNVKLFPQSLFILANTYILGEDYTRKLDELCRSYGLLSDDGDSIVDKYSGYVLRKIDFAEEEGYDEAGFKISTHEIMAGDLGATVASAFHKDTEKFTEKDADKISEKDAKKDTEKFTEKGQVRVFEDATSETIYNVFATLSRNATIPDDSGIEEFVMRTASELINNKDVVLSEASYAKRIAKLEKEKGKTSIPYSIYRGQTIITIVGCLFLIAVQTAVPSLNPKQTFPGCVKSFKGYPMGGEEDTSGIVYVACIMNKSKSSVAPWDSIEKLNAATLAKRMKEVLQAYILKRSDIGERFLTKREYLLVTPDENVPQELSLERWRQFLPPVVPFSIVKVLRGVSPEFAGEMWELMRKGNWAQFENIDMFRSKIIQHTYGIVESIHNIVKTKDTLMKTSALVPFLENACCNEQGRSIKPMPYFVEDEANIAIYIQKAHKMGEILEKVKRVSKPDMFYHAPFTGIVYPAVPMEHSENNVYAAFIHYCNFDRDVPIDDELAIISSEKPANYNRLWSIEEKTEFLKKHGKQYTLDNLNHLMNIVNRRNIVEVSSINEAGDAGPVSALRDILLALEHSDSTVVEEPLRRLLGEVVEAHNPRQMGYEDSAATVALKKHLTRTNTRMMRKIDEFINAHGNLSDGEYYKMREFIKNISVWTVDLANDPLANSSEDHGLYTVSQFMKNSIFAMAKSFPAIILNNADFTTVPAKWLDWSDDHKLKIVKTIQENTAALTRFKGDESLVHLLHFIQNKLVDLNMFAEHLPVNTPIRKEENTFYSLFDKDTTYKLFTYCWLSAIYEYVVASDDLNLLKIDVQLSKTARRKRNRDMMDESALLETVGLGGGGADSDDEADLEQVQIRAGDTKNLKENVCSLLLAYLNIDRANKETLDYSYEHIRTRTRRLRDAEKRSITAALENMSKDDRKTEDELKKYKIGRWNVGQQTGLFRYDKATYDSDHNTNVLRLFEETDRVDRVAEQGTVVDLEEYEKKMVDAQYNNEMNGIDDLDENYNDGAYYEEDRDEDAEH